MKRRFVIRILGVVLLVGVVCEGLLGSALVGAVSYPPTVLVMHIIVALLLVAVAAFAFAVGLGGRGISFQIAASFGLVACVGATVAGGIFLWGGKPIGAFHAMEYLTGAIVAVSIAFLTVPVGHRRAADMEKSQNRVS